MTVCIEDYQKTIYNLYCPSNQKVVVTRLSAAFVARSQPIIIDCIAESALILNNSNSISLRACDYCYNQNPCVINANIIDTYGLFSPNTYNVGNSFMPTPINIGFYYICIGNFFKNKLKFLGFLFSFISF